jgi:Tol biopolymer transport system component
VDGTEIQLTDGPDHSPRLRPGGAVVLFAREERGAISLYRIAANHGGGPELMVRDALAGDWSPDGTQVAFLRDESNPVGPAATIGIVGGSQGERVVGRIEGLEVRFPRWSPDGKWIAVNTTLPGVPDTTKYRIQLLQADPGESDTLAVVGQPVPFGWELRPPLADGGLSSISWAKDGRAIVYAQRVSSTTRWIVDTEVFSGACRLVRHDLATGRHQVEVFAPLSVGVLDAIGTNMVLDGEINWQELVEYDLPQCAAGKRVIAPQGTTIDRQPVYSPDGTSLVFASTRSGNLDIWLRSQSTGVARRLTEDSADDFDPAFTRDGNEIIWTSLRTGAFEIWMMRLDGTQERQASHDSVNAQNATMTADGNWLMYNSARPDEQGIWKARHGGSTASLLVPGFLRWPEVSPDGRYVSYTVLLNRYRTAVRVARVDNGEQVFETILDAYDQPNGRSRWWPDGTKLAFVWQAPGAPGVYAQEFAPGRNTDETRRCVVALAPHATAESFGISPDGSRIAVSAVQRNSNLLSAETGAGLQPQAEH